MDEVTPSATAWALVAASLVFCPLFAGIIDRVAGFISGRSGAGALLPYRELAALFGDRGPRPPFADGLAAAGGLTASTAMLLATPLGAESAALSFPGDFALWICALAGGQCFGVAVSTPETGDPFGREAGRSILLAAVNGATVFLVLATVLAVGGSLSLAGAFGNLFIPARAEYTVALALAAAAFFCVALAETGGVAFGGPDEDGPDHAGGTAAREPGGPEPAMLRYAGFVKLWIFASVSVQLILPRFGLVWLDVVRHFAGMAVFALLTGAVRAVSARPGRGMATVLLCLCCLLALAAPVVAWVRL